MFFVINRNYLRYRAITIPNVFGIAQLFIYNTLFLVREYQHSYIHEEMGWDSKLKRSETKYENLRGNRNSTGFIPLVRKRTKI